MKNKDLMNILRHQPMNAEIWVDVWDPCTEGYAGEPADAATVEIDDDQHHKIRIRSAWRGQED